MVRTFYWCENNYIIYRYNPQNSLILDLKRLLKMQLILFDIIYIDLNETRPFLCLFIDLTKAFATVGHTVFLQDMELGEIVLTCSEFI